MLRFFFEFVDFLCFFIPGGKNREKIRRIQLYDYKKKLNCLKKSYPELSFNKIRLVKGGWNIGFIVDNKYVFKIRKNYDDDVAIKKITRESRIVNAFAPLLSIKIPNITIKRCGEYTFYRYDFIKGKNLNEMPLKTMKGNREKLGKQLGNFIYILHNLYPQQIADLATPTDTGADGWNHNDLCNNIIIDPKTMDIVGIIDWEYAGYGALKSEFNNSIRFSSKMKMSGIIVEIMMEYFSNTHKK